MREEKEKWLPGAHKVLSESRIKALHPSGPRTQHQARVLPRELASRVPHVHRQVASAAPEPKQVFAEAEGDPEVGNPFRRALAQVLEDGGGRGIRAVGSIAFLNKNFGFGFIPYQEMTTCTK